MNAAEVKEKAGQMGQGVKETMQDWSNKATGKARDAGAAADLYLHEYAWTTMMCVALAAGLVGYFLGRQVED